MEQSEIVVNGEIVTTNGSNLVVQGSLIGCNGTKEIIRFFAVTGKS